MVNINVNIRDAVLSFKIFISPTIKICINANPRLYEEYLKPLIVKTYDIEIDDDELNINTDEITRKDTNFINKFFSLLLNDENNDKLTLFVNDRLTAVMNECYTEDDVLNIRDVFDLIYETHYDYFENDTARDIIDNLNKLIKKHLN